MSETEPLPVATKKKSVPARTAPLTARIAAAAPHHLVVFPEPHERNASKVASIMRVREQPRVAARSSYAVMQARGPGQAATRVFHRLGIAACDLSPEEIARFRAIDGVQVVENEVRRLPPYLEAEATSLAAPQVRGANAEAIAYLTGARDGIDLALRHFNGAPALLPHLQPTARAALQTASWSLQAINIRPPARTHAGKGVKVAVLDTGIDLNHPDLAGRAEQTESFVAGESVQDENGHGSHCAGVIAALDKTIGRYPYSCAPEVELMIGKVLNRLGRGSDDQIIDAMDWAADNGAQVISMSLGSEREPNEPYAVAYETIARALLKSGVLVVAAAGNESNRPFYKRPVGNPAACPSILAVAALDQALSVASFSCSKMDNIGEVNISGPGVAVYSSWTGGGFKTISGTSMATPHVAGVAALLLEKHGKTATGKKLWHLLTAGARPLGDAADYGAGLVQAP